jgi:opacity protein-like surface antigen
MGRKVFVFFMIMAIFACTSAMAASDIGFKGANLRIAYVMPEDPIEATIGFGGGVDLGTITENIGLSVAVLYWSKSYDVGTYSWKYSDFAIKVNGKYYFPAEKMKPYVGAGLGIHMYSFEWEAPAFMGYGGGTVTDSQTKFGFHALGGVEFPLGDKLGAFVEAEYDLADIDQFIIGGGVSMKFGK